ncbi:NAD(P)H-hydrate dehydratase [Capillibacterium thermochitinicola]|uniref:Bifunctional NAD(P)H-hydrate repair enzyme n=1 Tax=Capillibacterium thermochitinicola TaxID=2699427 RepID=A0A8J6LMR1_9FIRM|nr:NAD(P)H-hydrate dehydratase [Capillibacterium thermochitinicola]MBA2133068.1 NAD(P)H-hydrate dehydratase [Capillibacterium thermochitinicola]
MKVAMAQEMREIDRLAMAEYAYPGLLLMEHAALALFQAIKARFPLGKVGIICGKGNNAGDGWALARLLTLDGVEVTVFTPGEEQPLPPDAATNRAIARRLGIREVPWATLLAAPAMLSSFAVLVDALLGTGFRGEVAAEMAAVIKVLNAADRPVVAVDLPSGVEADTGRVPGPAVRATLTVTFGLPKVGLLVYPGREYVGEVIVDDIGLPPPLLREQATGYYTLNRSELAALLPQRKAEAHKGTQGHLLVVGGSPGMTGAPVLAGLAALRSGAGLVTLGVRDGLTLPEKPMELIVKPWSQLQWDAYDAIVAGPGLSTQPDGQAILATILGLAGPCRLLDADALNLLAPIPRWWEQVKGSLVLTPHPGEMARLCGLTTGEVQANRLGLVKEKSREWGVTLVLKGAATLVGSGEEPIYINTTGNPALATGGTGDVLAGMIGGLLAQGLAPAQAAAVGVYLHGQAGDLAAREIGPAGILAGDLLPRIPRVMEWGQANVDR